MSRHRSADEPDPIDSANADSREVPEEAQPPQGDVRPIAFAQDAPRMSEMVEREGDSGQGVERSYYLRERVCSLCESEFRTLTEVGKFRVIDSADLAKFSYRGDATRLSRDIRHLEREGLLIRRHISAEPKAARRLVTLTKKGKRLLLESGRIPEGQSLYHGIVKPRELKHDAALYRVYQQAANRILQSGGRPVRAVLDYELKRRVQRDIARQPAEPEYRESRQEIAENHGLAFVAGKIQIPDLRIEYENADQQRARIDLELATRNYRPRALAAKARAGFSLYAPREDATRLRRILDESELTAKILSL